MILRKILKAIQRQLSQNKLFLPLLFHLFFFLPIIKFIPAFIMFFHFAHQKNQLIHIPNYNQTYRIFIIFFIK